MWRDEKFVFFHDQYILLSTHYLTNRPQRELYEEKQQKISFINTLQQFLGSWDETAMSCSITCSLSLVFGTHCMYFIFKQKSYYHVICQPPFYTVIVSIYLEFLWIRHLGHFNWIRTTVSGSRIKVQKKKNSCVVKRKEYSTFKWPTYVRTQSISSLTDSRTVTETIMKPEMIANFSQDALWIFPCWIYWSEWYSNAWCENKILSERQ